VVRDKSQFCGKLYFLISAFLFHEFNDGDGPIRLPPNAGLQAVDLIPTRSASFEVILHTVRNEAVDFLAIVPSPPQLIFQQYTFSTGGEG